MEIGEWRVENGEQITENPSHRRRKETEGKAKVVTSVWGAKFVQFLAALAILSQSI